MDVVTASHSHQDHCVGCPPPPLPASYLRAGGSDVWVLNEIWVGHQRKECLEWRAACTTGLTANPRAGYKEVGFVVKTLDGPVSKRLAFCSPGKRGSATWALGTSSEDRDGAGPQGDKGS